MGASIEFSPAKAMPEEWPQQLFDGLFLVNNTVTITKKSDDFYRLTVNQLVLFDVWLPKKDITVFPDTDYIEGIRWLEKINIPDFLEKFKAIDYSILLEIRYSLDEKEQELIITAAKEIVRLCDGIALFDQDIGSYKHHHVYLLSDFE